MMRDNETVSSQVLANLGLNLDAVRGQIQEVSKDLA
jgi:hypothetical protein